ncbi:MAG: ECF transporter S component [Zhaonellaceae bacterium]|jgi:thiamine transporter ThiT|nr:ECF transporter S component [Clostridia bacterium]
MNFRTKDLAEGAIFLALGLLIPYIFHATGIPGQVFLPMHIPVLLCGFMVGHPYGLIVGFITPLLNAFLTGMPPIYPTAVAMSFELATYGLVAGWLYRSRGLNLFVSLIISMVLGRVVSGMANFILLGLAGQKYGFQAFLMSAFVKAFWGIIIQLIVIPVVIKTVGKARGETNLNG